jgi:hypothetical protein
MMVASQIARIVLEIIWAVDVLLPLPFMMLFVFSMKKVQGRSRMKEP